MPSMSNSEWIERCAARFIQVGGLNTNVAFEQAKICYDMDDPADGITPEQAADNEMDCWSS